MLTRDLLDDDDERNKKQPVGAPVPLPETTLAPEALPSVTAATPATGGGALSAMTGAEGRRGWNNLLLDAPATRSPAKFEGFNTERASAGGDPNSVKDATYRWLQGLDFNPAGKSKDEIGSYFKSQIPDARNAGLNILDVIGDQFLIETKERGPEWVDVVRNAGGGDDVAYQWLTQQEFGNTDQGGFPQAFGQLQGMPGGSDILTALLMDGGLSGSPLMERINQELQKLLLGQQAGTTTPTPGSAGIEDLLTGVL